MANLGFYSVILLCPFVTTETQKNNKMLLSINIVSQLPKKCLNLTNAIILYSHGNNLRIKISIKNFKQINYTLTSTSVPVPASNF